MESQQTNLEKYQKQWLELQPQAEKLPLLMSLLYDFDLMPEQAWDHESSLRDMLLIVTAMMNQNEESFNAGFGRAA